MWRCLGIKSPAEPQESTFKIKLSGALTNNMSKADERAAPGTARLSVAEPEVRVLDAAKQQLG
jgi:hypothetical protein